MNRPLYASLIIVFTFCILISINLQAQNLDKLVLEQPLLSGTGCPTGTTSSILTPDQATLSILFDQFQVALPQNQGINDNTTLSEINSIRTDRFNPIRDHKICDIKINTRLPKLHYLEAVEVSFDFRGFSFVEPGAVVTFKSMFFPQKENNTYERGGQVLTEKIWKGMRTNIDTDWLLQSKKIIPLQQNCQHFLAAGKEYQNLQLHLKNMLLADIPRGNYGRPPYPRANITLDSADITSTSQMKIVLKMKACPTSRIPRR